MKILKLLWDGSEGWKFGHIPLILGPVICFLMGAYILSVLAMFVLIDFICYLAIPDNYTKPNPLIPGGGIYRFIKFYKEDKNVNK